MEGDDFDRQLKELLETERRKAPYTEYSLDEQHESLLADFYHYYADLYGLDEDDSMVSDTSEQDELFDDGYQANPLEQRLEEYLDELVVKYELPLEGTIKIAGSGLYAGATEQGTYVGYDILQEGHIIGSIQRYVVLPMPTDGFRAQIARADEIREGEELPSASGVSGVWQLLEHATLYDAAGQPLETFEDVFVPMAEPGLRFALLEYQGDRVLETMPDSEDVRIDVLDSLKGEFICERFTDAENYLNYDAYAGDELREHRDQFQQELGIYTAMVDRETPYTLTAFSATDIQGDVKELQRVQALYLDPVFVKVGSSWRVAHSFEVVVETGVLLVHVLPEAIIEINS